MKLYFIFYLTYLLFISNLGITSKACSQESKSNTSSIKVFNDDIVNNFFNINVFKADTFILKSIFTIKPRVKIIRSRIEHGTDNFGYSLSAKKTKINFYFKAGEGFYLDKAIIRDSALKLWKSINIGMKKDSLLKSLGIQEHNNCDSLVVTNDDQTINIYFLFQKNRLKEIRITSEI
jgi:hypothetical protein